MRVPSRETLFGSAFTGASVLATVTLVAACAPAPTSSSPVGGEATTGSDSAINTNTYTNTTGTVATNVTPSSASPNGASGALVVASDAPADLSGVWRSDSGAVLFRQVGDEVWGVFLFDRGTTQYIRVRGRFLEGTLHGRYCNNLGGEEGDLVVTVRKPHVGAPSLRWINRLDGTSSWFRYDFVPSREAPRAVLLAGFDDPGAFCPPVALRTEPYAP